MIGKRDIHTKNEARRVVGYTRTFLFSKEACDIQKYMIEEYCKSNSILCTQIFCDIGYAKKRLAKERWKAEKIGLDTKNWLHVFRAWEDMLLGVVDGEIGCILVDTKARLFDGVEQREVVERLCKQYDVHIIEVSGGNPIGTSALMKVAVYHYPVQFGARTCILLNDIDSLYDYASHRKRWEVVSLFLDLSSNNREEFAHMLEIAKCDIVLVKNFFHVKRHMASFIGVVKQIHKKGIRLVSMDEGELTVMDNECADLLKRPLNAAVYDWHKSEYQEENEKLQIEKFQAFVKFKTDGWTIRNIYIDGIRSGTKEELQRLINDVERYDIILIDSFDKFGETIKCIKIIKALNIPVYSLRERVCINEAEDL